MRLVEDNGCGDVLVPVFGFTPDAMRRLGWEPESFPAEAFDAEIQVSDASPVLRRLTCLTGSGDPAALASWSQAAHAVGLLAVLVATERDTPPSPDWPPPPTRDDLERHIGWVNPRTQAWELLRPNPQLAIHLLPPDGDPNLQAWAAEYLALEPAFDPQWTDTDGWRVSMHPMADNRLRAAYRQLRLQESQGFAAMSLSANKPRRQAANEPTAFALAASAVGSRDASAGQISSLFPTVLTELCDEDGACLQLVHVPHDTQCGYHLEIRGTDPAHALRIRSLEVAGKRRLIERHADNALWVVELAGHEVRTALKGNLPFKIQLEPNPTVP
jgi:hypothetical protein